MASKRHLITVIIARYYRFFCHFLVAVTLSCGAHAAPSAPVQFPSELATAIESVRTTIKRSGNNYWPGFSNAPYGFLLVEEKGEILACEDRIPSGFTQVGTDPILKCPLATGPRSWREPSLLAAMPVFGLPTTIVMGSPVATGKSLPEWQATVIHEHFHQWQYALPDYFSRVEALGLAGGDETGMWMINYPFPYEKTEVENAYAKASLALAEAIHAPQRQLKEKTLAYLSLREAFKATVSAADWRYFELQLWQEGVARWTEFEVAERSKDPAIAKAGGEIRQRVLQSLRTPNLARSKRLSVYALGAGEAMLLDRTNQRWRKCYPKMLALGPMLTRSCPQKP